MTQSGNLRADASNTERAWSHINTPEVRSQVHRHTKYLNLHRHKFVIRKALSILSKLKLHHEELSVDILRAKISFTNGKVPLVESDFPIWAVKLGFQAPKIESTMDRRKLSDSEIKSALGRLANWELKDGKLNREFRFRDFNEAFGFMTRVALVAENLRHHPEWTNIYGTVVVSLATHEVQGITDYDLILAGKMDVFAEATKRPLAVT